MKKYVYDNAGNKMEIKNLEAIYDARKSFYGKATYCDNGEGTITLFSYDRRVAYIDAEGFHEVQGVSGSESMTTQRHIREFKKQFLTA